MVSDSNGARLIAASGTGASSGVVTVPKSLLIALDVVLHGRSRAVSNRAVDAVLAGLGQPVSARRMYFQRYVDYPNMEDARQQMTPDHLTRNLYLVCLWVADDQEEMPSQLFDAIRRVLRFRSVLRGRTYSDGAMAILGAMDRWEDHFVEITSALGDARADSTITVGRA